MATAEYDEAGGGDGLGALWGSSPGSSGSGSSGMGRGMLLVMETVMTGRAVHSGDSSISVGMLMLLWAELVVTVTPQLEMRLVWAGLTAALRLWRLLRAERLRLTGELELSLDRLMWSPHGELSLLVLCTCP